MADESVQAELERLRAENEALKRGKRPDGVSFRVSEKAPSLSTVLGDFR